MGTPGKLTISRLVFGLVAMLVLGLWAAALHDAHRQYTAFTETQAALDANGVADHLLAAGRALVAERGEIALRLDGAPGWPGVAPIASHRRDGGAELALALPHLPRSDDLRAALNRLDQARASVDQALAQPAPRRDPALPELWRQVSDAALSEIEDCVRDIALKGNKGVTVVRRLTRVKLWALELYRTQSDEAARVAATAAANRRLSPAELMALSRLRGTAEVLSADLRTEAESLDIAALRTAVADVQRATAAGLSPAEDRMVAASLDHDRPSEPQVDVLRAGPPREYLTTLMEVASRETDAQARTANRGAGRALTAHSALALAAFGFGAAAVALLRRRLLAPLRQLRHDLRRLARGDLDIAADGPSHHDELGQMHTAIVEFRDVLDERRALWNAMPDFICVKDSAGRWQWINAAAASLFDLEDADYRGRNDDEIAAIAPHLGPWLRSSAAADETVRRDRVTQSREEVISNSRGDAHFFQVLRVPLFRADHTCRGSVALGRDVTDRRRTEVAMARLAQQNQLLLDCAGEGIIGLDGQGNITFVNPAVERMIGRDGPDMIGEHQHALMHHHHPDGGIYAEQDCPIHRTLTDGRTRQCERETFWRRDGTALAVEFTVTAILEQDDVRGAVIIFRDIQSRLAAEQEIDSLLADLKRSNAELERFAYVASHDLRQPLRMITSYLTLLTRRLTGRLGAEEEEFVDFAVDGARRMDRMILDLLDYSRIGRGDGMEPVRLTEVIDGALSSLRPAMAECGAEVEIPHDLPRVAGIRSELERLFQNLIGNAIKFRVEGRPPRIAITCDSRDDAWVIAIADNGIGIDAKDHDRLFNLFQRLVPDASYEGTGIGLASCRKIVEHHGGRIWVTSLPGQGATFLFTLPKPVGEDTPVRKAG